MIKFQTETTDISRNIGIEMGKKQYGFTDIDRFDHRVDRNNRIFNFGGNGRYSPKDGYFWRAGVGVVEVGQDAGAWSGDRGRRRNDA